MRSSVAILAALLLVASALTGCLGGDEPSGADAAVAVNETGASNLTVDDGTTEMDMDIGHMPHLHDYWMGKERVTIMDDDVEVDQFSATFFTFFNTFQGTPGVGGTFFQLPEGSLVYEGTGKLEILPTWTDPTVTGAGIRYRSPSSETFSDVVPLVQGAALTLDITPEMTDMPHDKESRWMFLLVPAQAGQSVVGKVHFRMDIVRIRDIETFPGHPELFGGANTIILFDGVAKSASQSFPARLAGAMTGNELESGVRSAAVVPMETLTMTANVTITSATANLGAVSDIEFLYHAAGDFGFDRAQVISADMATGIFQFGWPVKMSQTDSPYAKTSQWAFDLRIQTDPTGMGTQMNGLADAEVEYQLQVIAYDSLLEGIEASEEDEEDR